MTRTWRRPIRRAALTAAAALLLAGACALPPTRASASPRPHAAGASRPSLATPPQLPRGGRVILGHYRVVAYYGVPGNAALGVLGSASAEHIATLVANRAAGYKQFGRPVQPAFEIIATVAQGSPGADGDYSQPIPTSTLKHYLAVAHEHKLYVVLDLQPGRASFLSQAKLMRSLLLDPSVGLALDPEWKVGPHQKPGNGLIGSSSAAGVNAVVSYLSALVKAHNLPDKLLIVHEFTPRMLPDRSKIKPAAGVEVTFHADGFGTPAVKTSVYHQLAFPGRPFGAGFKLFLHQDSRLMTPAEVMKLRPQPDVVTYQ